MSSTSSSGTSALASEGCSEGGVSPCCGATGVERTASEGSFWLRPGIKPWCLRRLWRPSPSLVPGAAGLGVPVPGRGVFLAGGSMSRAPGMEKNTGRGPVSWPGGQTRNWSVWKGKATLDFPPGASPPVPWCGGCGAQHPGGSVLAPRVHPQPRWGSWAQPQSGEPWDSPQVLHPLGSFGHCNPRGGGSPGTTPTPPTLQLGLPGSGSAWCSKIIYSGAPGNPLAASGSPRSHSQAAWGQLGQWGSPSVVPHPTPTPCSSRGWAETGWHSHPRAAEGGRNAGLPISREGCSLGDPNRTRGGPVWDLGVLDGDGDVPGALCAADGVLAGDGVRAARQAGKALSTGRSGKHGCKSASGSWRLITALGASCARRCTQAPCPGVRRGLGGRMRPPGFGGQGLPARSASHAFRPRGAREAGVGCSRSPSWPWPLHPPPP